MIKDPEVVGLSGNGWGDSTPSFTVGSKGHCSQPVFGPCRRTCVLTTELCNDPLHRRSGTYPKEVPTEKVKQWGPFSRYCGFFGSVIKKCGVLFVRPCGRSLPLQWQLYCREKNRDQERRPRPDGSFLDRSRDRSWSRIPSTVDELPGPFHWLSVLQDGSSPPSVWELSLNLVGKSKSSQIPVRGPFLLQCPSEKMDKDSYVLRNLY